ncbi:hypothetical protein Tco_0344048 [Tanacetum coccineum]
MCRVGSGQRGCDGLAVGTAGDNPRGALVGAAAARGAFGRLPNSRGVEYGSGQPGGKGLVGLCHASRVRLAVTANKGAFGIKTAHKGAVWFKG